MFAIKSYERTRAFTYAKRWAFARNPLFNDYSPYGGNCTSFASQCALAASLVMNTTPTFGWYYRSDADRAPAWTGVEPFFRFLTQNTEEGPFGREVARETLAIGDFIQLGRSNDDFYHTLVVVGLEGEDILVAAHSDDAFMRPLSTYTYEQARFLHIEGVRVPLGNEEDPFYDFLEGRALPPVGIYRPTPEPDTSPAPSPTPMPSSPEPAPTPAPAPTDAAPPATE